MTVKVLVSDIPYMLDYLEPGNYVGAKAEGFMVLAADVAFVINSHPSYCFIGLTAEKVMPILIEYFKLCCSKGVDHHYDHSGFIFIYKMWRAQENRKALMSIAGSKPESKATGVMM